MSRALPHVIVGAGLAGLCTALACAPHPVVVIDAGHGGDRSSSALAQGGIAAAIGAGDSPAAHACDTLEAGAHHNDAAVVDRLVRAAPQAVEWLARQGVAFDRDGHALALGREGGHGCARIVHAGGDSTGAYVMSALRERLRRASHVELREGVEVDALLRRGIAVRGVRTVDRHGARTQVDASAVVLATGGIGGLYARTTNPASHRGHGLALALAAGARVRDLEFVQFHPTALAVDGERLPLVTEALRGAGAVLVDAAGRPATAGLHPLGDLAPRDIVARRLWTLAQHGGAWLDATRLPPDVLDRFPTVLAACRRHGVDPAREPVPVTPAAHFHMGGIAVNAVGATGIPGLYAVGEVACSGVHGANRLASNSLLECVAVGRTLGALLAQPPVRAVRRFDREVVCDAGTPLAGSERAVLRECMWTAAGPVRTMRGFGIAALRLRDLDEHAREVRVAMAVLRAAASNPRRLGAHWVEAAPAAAMAAATA